MADGFTATVDTSALLALFDRLGPSTEYVCREVGRDTATRIVAEAQQRVRRTSGDTRSGIHWELSRDRKGYVVMAYNGTQPPVDKYLELGTKYMRANPFFFASALAENGPHLRRLQEAIETFLSDVGR